MANRETAAGDIGLVQAFVNTVDLEDGPEELEDPNTLKAWLVAKNLMDGSQPVDASDLKHAIALREAIRGVIGAGSGFPGLPPRRRHAERGRGCQQLANAIRRGW